ncbi:serine/threonine-protein kinase [Schinkia azotoformans]|nr:serine/threonine-protein kinase [Schinkia azotoformans]
METSEKDIFLEKNALLKNIYKIKSVISYSDLSIVYLVDNQKNNKVQVMKEYYPKLLAIRDLDQKVVVCRLPRLKEKFEQLKKAFSQEAELLKILNHQHIVAYYDDFEENGTCYIVTEYCDGKQFDQFVKGDRKYILSSFFKKTILPLIDTLDYIHKSGIIHRDIKPSNIIIGQDGCPTIIDFGSAINLNETNSKTIFTTSGYSPIEFYSDCSEKGIYSDIYSLTATLYYFLTKSHPLDVSERIIEDRIEPIRKYNRRLSPLVSNVIMWGLAVNYKKRCPSLKFIKIAIYVEYLILKLKKI